jgi:hypothetical protein
MVTEKDFQEAVAATEEFSYLDDTNYIPTETAGTACFELAKKMAIEFAAWIFVNDYHAVITEHGGRFWTKGFHGQRLSTHQLFELYQQSKTT